MTDDRTLPESFRGQNLEGADFSGSDVRGADFTGCNLRSAKFTNAQIGVPRRVGAVLLGLALLVAIPAAWRSVDRR